MSRFRVGLAVVAMTVTALAVPGSFTAGGGVANAAPIPGGSITAVCAGTTNGTTFTLTADCGEVTTSLTVPANITTVDGGGHTISATDLNGADPTVHTPIPQFNGGIVTNATPGQTMNIQNVTITGPAAGFSALHEQQQRVVRDLLQRCGRRFGDQCDRRSHLSVPERRVRFLPDGQGYPGGRTRALSRSPTRWSGIIKRAGSRRAARRS